MTLTGAVAKGPFILGTNVTVSPVDSSGNTTGMQFTTQTSDNAGDFSVVFTYTGPVMLSASGYYYNEIAGALSQSTLSLDGMAAITSSGSQNAYINMLSDIAFGRVKTLMGGGAALAAAVTQADTELYGQLDVAGPSFNPGADATQLNLLAGNTPQAAYLFAASSVVEQAAALSNVSGGTDAKVQSLINTLAADFGPAGTFTSSDNTTLQTGVRCVEPDSDMASLQARFTTIGSSAVVPNINLALDTDGDGVVNATDTCVLIPNATQSVVPNGICNYQFVETTAVSGGGTCIQFNGNSPTLVGAFDGTSGNDIIVAQCTDLYLYVNQGGTSFAAPVALGLPATLGATGSDNLSLGFVTAVDMNGDSKLDLFMQYGIMNQGNTVLANQFAYMPGDGMGHFGSPVAVGTGPSCGGSGATCTLNTQCCSNFCSAHPGMDGGIVTGTCQGGGQTAGYSYAVVTDLNQDGVPDVAALGGFSNAYTLSTVLSVGGAWGATTSVPLPSGSYQLEGLAYGKLRNATDVDLAIATLGSGIYLLPGSGTGVYATPTAGFMGLGASVLNVGIADLDVDGHPDIIGTSYGSASVLEIQWGDGTLSPAPTPYPVNTTAVSSPCPTPMSSCGGQCAVPFAIGDVTGDGKPDLNPGIGSQSLAVNGGNRTFAQPVAVWQGGGASAGASMSSNVLADMNGDGRADLVLASGAPKVILIDQLNHFSW